MKPVRLLVVLFSLGTVGCAPLLGAFPSAYPYGPPMRRAHAAPPPVALPTGRWDNVVGLAPGTMLAVISADGTVYTGAFVKAGMQWLRVADKGAEREVGREDVMRIDLLSRGQGGPSGGEIARGAAEGALMAGGAMMVVPYLISGDVWLPPARFWGVGAALGAAGAVQKNRLAAHSRTIYLAPDLVGR